MSACEVAVLCLSAFVFICMCSPCLSPSVSLSLCLSLCTDCFRPLCSLCSTRFAVVTVVRVGDGGRGCAFPSALSDCGFAPFAGHGVRDLSFLRHMIVPSHWRVHVIQFDVPVDPVQLSVFGELQPTYGDEQMRNLKQRFVRLTSSSVCYPS